MNLKSTAEKISSDGFAIIEKLFTDAEVDLLLQAVSKVDTSKSSFRKTKELFAIRQFLIEVPAAAELIFTPTLNSILSKLFGEDYFVVKSIYFDKPVHSNWFVAYHQDLTISVDKKIESPGFSSWTIKQNLFAVQPPIEILKNNFTIRIHLDDTNENNGALKVIAKSHLKGIYSSERIDLSNESETICTVKKGGIMIMKPLLLHASDKTINNNKRRVIHIEFSNTSLPAPLHWGEPFPNNHTPA